MSNLLKKYSTEEPTPLKKLYKPPAKRNLLVKKRLKKHY